MRCSESEVFTHAYDLLTGKVRVDNLVEATLS